MKVRSTMPRPWGADADGSDRDGAASGARLHPTADDAMNSADVPNRLTYRIAEVAIMLGVSRRTIERELSAGRFPRADVRVGKSPLWSRETLTRWIAGGGGR